MFQLSSWSNGWTANPITFKLNSNIGFSANFPITIILKEQFMTMV